MSAVSHEQLREDIKAASGKVNSTHNWVKAIAALSVGAFGWAAVEFYAQGKAIAIIGTEVKLMAANQAGFIISIDQIRRDMTTNKEENDRKSEARQSELRSEFSHEMERHEDKGH